MTKTLAVALASMMLAGCSHAGGRVVVTATGRIGPLHVDTSNRADVIAFAGRPESETRGRYTSSYPPFDALGYSCKGKRATLKGGVPGCETVFYLDAHSGKLALLYTEDTRYEYAGGVHVGTSTASAETLLKSRVFVGCFAGLRFETNTGLLVLWFEGGKTLTRGTNLRLVGGHVAFLVVHSRRLNPGVLDCIDS